jgi:hypothetical protein
VLQGSRTVWHIAAVVYGLSSATVGIIIGYLHPQLLGPCIHFINEVFMLPPIFQNSTKHHWYEPTAMAIIYPNVISSPGLGKFEFPILEAFHWWLPFPCA